MSYKEVVEYLEKILGKADPIWKNYYLKFLNSRKQTTKQESHHIIPVSLLPKDSDLIKNPDNLIILTYREHFIAHLLLYKMYPKCRQLITAAYFLGVLKSKYFLTSRQFETLRKTFQEKQRDFTLSTIDNYKEKISKSVKGLWQNEKYSEHLLKHLEKLHSREDYGNLISVGIKNKNTPKEMLSRSKKARQAQLNDPNWSKNHSEKVKAAFASEEKRAHQREMTLRSLQNPEVQKNKKKGYLKVKLGWVEKALAKDNSEQKREELLRKKEELLEELKCVEI